MSKMAQVIEVEMKCGRCKVDFSRPAWQWVVIDDQPENAALTALQSGILNRVECPNCGAPGFIGIPVMLHIPRQQRLLVYLPQLSRLTDAGLSAVLKPILEPYIASLPPAGRADYLYQPDVTEDWEMLQDLANGRSEAIASENDNLDD